MLESSATRNTAVHVLYKLVSNIRAFNHLKWSRNLFLEKESKNR
jgi:hypothetical protein